MKTNYAFRFWQWPDGGHFAKRLFVVVAALKNIYYGLFIYIFIFVVVGLLSFLFLKMCCFLCVCGGFFGGRGLWVFCCCFFVVFFVCFCCCLLVCLLIYLFVAVVLLCIVVVFL